MLSRRAITRFYLIILSVGALGLWGCSVVGTDGKPDVDEHLLPVASIQVLEQQENHVTFRIFAGGSLCDRITRVEAERASRTYDVEVYGRRSPETACVAVVLPTVGTWEMGLPGSGTYTFRFSRGDAAPLDTTLAFVGEAHVRSRLILQDTRRPKLATTY